MLLPQSVHNRTTTIKSIDKMKKQIILAVSLASALGACGPTPSDKAPVTATNGEQSKAAEAESSAPQAVTSRYLHATPSLLEDCKRGQSVDLKWDLGTDFPGVTGVEIYVGADGQEKLFSAGGAKGETKTGLWTKPGSIFRLKNKKSGEEIERITIAGPSC